MNYGDDPLLEKLEVLQTSFQPFILCVIYNPQGRYARLWVISYMVIKNKGKHYQFSIKKKKKGKTEGKKTKRKNYAALSMPASLSCYLWTYSFATWMGKLHCGLHSTVSLERTGGLTIMSINKSNSQDIEKKGKDNDWLMEMTAADIRPVKCLHNGNPEKPAQQFRIKIWKF